MAGLSIPQPGSSASGRKGGRQRRKKNGAFGLQITSLMDVLIIIVIFLLKSYGLSSMSIVQPDKLQLPVSKSIEAFGEGVVLVIAQDQITIDSEPVLQFVPNPNAPAPAPQGATAAGSVVGPDGKPMPQQEISNATFELPPNAIDSERGIVAIYDVLARKKEEFDTLASRQPNPEEAKKKWTGELFVQADKNVPYELLRQVMLTSARPGYRTFRLTVEKQAEE